MQTHTCRSPKLRSEFWGSSSRALLELGRPPPPPTPTERYTAVAGRATEQAALAGGLVEQADGVPCRHGPLQAGWLAGWLAGGYGGRGGVGVGGGGGGGGGGARGANAAANAACGRPPRHTPGARSVRSQEGAERSSPGPPAWRSAMSCAICSTSSEAWFMDSSKRRASTSLRYRSAAIQRDRQATSRVVCVCVCRGGGVGWGC